MVLPEKIIGKWGKSVLFYGVKKSASFTWGHKTRNTLTTICAGCGSCFSIPYAENDLPMRICRVL
jgi:hypothetical protein